jgi:hypothetical protein
VGDAARRPPGARLQGVWIMTRLFALLLALLGAAALSQGPEFAQQYMQRLAGAVDELREFATRFESDAGAVGISRDEALAAYAESGDFLTLQGVGVEDTLDRFDRLEDHLNGLRRANEYRRSLLIVQEHDLPLLRATAHDYAPALPLTLAGAAHAGAGFILGWILGAVIGGLIGLLLSPLFGRRKQAI